MQEKSWQTTIDCVDNNFVLQLLVIWTGGLKASMIFGEAG
jgi:hypothetical protein